MRFTPDPSRWSRHGRVAGALALLLAGCSEPANEAAANGEANGLQNGAKGLVGGSSAAGPEFIAISDLSPPSGFTPVVRGARPVENPNDWTGSFQVAAQEACTATVVGEWVVLTAAHCVLDNGRIRMGKAGVQYGGTCNQAPAYKQGDKSADYALCKLDTPIPGVAAERINSDAGLLEVGKPILLTGFGCINDDGTGGNDYVYRIGEVNVSRLPSGGSNEIVTKGKVGACFGDSGGPAFKVLGNGRRVQVSVNSTAEDLDPGPAKRFGPQSNLASLTSPAAKKFLDDWRRPKQLTICGLDDGATTCRPG